MDNLGNEVILKVKVSFGLLLGLLKLLKLFIK